MLGQPRAKGLTLIGLAVGADTAVATAYFAEYAQGPGGALSMLRTFERQAESPGSQTTRVGKEAPAHG